ncbi:gephyrin-like molybdotransferase Glp [Paenibacillus sp. YYML68]|uniref:molybdopterin molybdotransferase MoeA n=1 Tax=Paenibacillus sp. YYML68 TaxID=2909250 RepID=UPI002492269B|nr:gephyrin-like molybdotransferase Glp [Paenibacillus sp. YYML68]
MERESNWRIEGAAPPVQVDEAVRLMLEHIDRKKLSRKERVPLGESLGRVLASNVTAAQSVPRFDRSMMDGFAVRVEDVLGARSESPARLKVVGSVKAGEVPGRPLAEGEAIRIMTGAMIPAGANAVCRFEATKGRFRPDVEEIEVLAPLKRGDNISFRGEDIAMGSVVLAEGSLIGAAEIAVLATFGISEVDVFRRPVVGIVASGTELIDVAGPLKPGQIYDSNSYMLAALIREAGGVPRQVLPVADDVDSISMAIGDVLEGVDMVVTTGGVSVGDTDVMHAVYERLHASTVFWKVLMRPGSPLRFAMKGDIPFFGLSGNVAACFVNAQLFVLPALRAMSGFNGATLPFIQARLVTKMDLVPIKPVRFLRAEAYMEGSELKVAMARGQSSGMIGSFIGANCLIRLNGGAALRVGDTVPIMVYRSIHMKC